VEQKKATHRQDRAPTPDPASKADEKVVPFPSTTKIPRNNTSRNCRFA